MTARPGGPIVAIDLETTGLFPESDRIVEIGAVRFDANGVESGRFERLVHPGRPMSPSAERIHGISDAMLAGADPAAVVLPDFLLWLEEDPPGLVLAHHARFDAAFLGRELARLGRPLPALEVSDTLALARRLFPRAPSHRLEVLCEQLGIDPGPAHRAIADCLRVKGLWLAIGGQGGPLVRYPIFDPSRGDTAPSGWEAVSEAIARGARLRIRYAGGSRGPGPREIVPRRFSHKGGAAYLVAVCLEDGFEKAFRLDRVRSIEELGPSGAGSIPPSTGLRPDAPLEPTPRGD
ncbi:exonuclease domain-containing protein [Tautonia sociabilis]|uniref:WYL domain-containing protein n=1 Tax=Tautonia sociabilis TaxID=2080755 RepID=A0A432MF01_9BACT|nr:exonuclease domain-containing protein [Tautonia sociabilis]RUL84327.1 WYL domain-containing protein [Tautonia sociabilis]